MKLIDTKKVNIGDNEYPIKITNRAMIEYEKLSGGSILSFDSTEKVIMFFYCTAKAGAKSEGKEFNYTYDEFLDAIDEHYLETITNFTKALDEGKVAETQDEKKKK